MSDEKVTKPPIETVLERIALMEARLSDRLERIEIRLDRVESMVLEVRADFRESVSYTHLTLPTTPYV